MTDDSGKAWSCRSTGRHRAHLPDDNLSEAEAQSLRIFADPKFRSRISIGDNVDDAYALASLVLGLKDWTAMTDAQFAEASAFLREVHKNVRVYWTDNVDIDAAFTNGEIDLAWGWNETYQTLTKQGCRSRLSATQRRARAPGCAATCCSRTRRQPRQRL